MTYFNAIKHSSINNLPPFSNTTQFIFDSIGTLLTNSSSGFDSNPNPPSSWPPNKFFAISYPSINFSNSSTSSLVPLWEIFNPIKVQRWSPPKSTKTVGCDETTKIISPTFSLGSKRRPGLLITMFEE